MKGTVLYQICIEGRYKNIDDTNKYSSKKVFIENPTQSDIDEFTEMCCNSGDEYSLCDLDKETIKIKINELIIS